MLVFILVESLLIVSCGWNAMLQATGSGLLGAHHGWMIQHRNIGSQLSIDLKLGGDGRILLTLSPCCGPLWGTVCPCKSFRESLMCWTNAPATGPALSHSSLYEAVAGTIRHLTASLCPFPGLIFPFSSFSLPWNGTFQTMSALEFLLKLCFLDDPKTPGLAFVPAT